MYCELQAQRQSPGHLSAPQNPHGALLRHCLVVSLVLSKLPIKSKVISRPFAGLYTRNHHQRKSHPPSFLGCHSSDPNFYAIKQANKSSHTWFLIKAQKKPLCLQLITSTITGWRGHEILTALDDRLEFSKAGHPRLPFASTTRTTAIKVSVPSGLDGPKYPGQTAWQIKSHFTVLFELAGLTATDMPQKSSRGKNWHQNVDGNCSNARGVITCQSRGGDVFICLFHH